MQAQNEGPPLRVCGANRLAQPINVALRTGGSEQRGCGGSDGLAAVCMLKSDHAAAKISEDCRAGVQISG